MVTIKSKPLKTINILPNKYYTVGPPLSPSAGLSLSAPIANIYTSPWRYPIWSLPASCEALTMATTCATVSPETKKPNSITINGFRISTQKLPILKADPIEEMTRKLGIAPPEMIFGDNYVAIEHEKANWGINFNAFDALDLVDKTGQSMLQVAYSGEWQKSRYYCSTLTCTYSIVAC